MTPGSRRVVVWLAAAVMTALTMKLGFWQWRRAAEKEQAQVHMLAQQHQPPWGNADWPCEGTSQAGGHLPLYRPVVLLGHWLPEKTVLLDNRPMDGQSGFLAVTPLQLDGAAGPCRGRVVLVERGWVPRDAHDRLKLPAIDTPTGMVSLSGRVVEGLSRTYQLGSEPSVASTSRGPLLRQNADEALWQAWLGQTPLPGAVQQLNPDVAGTPADHAADVLRRNWPEPSQGQARNLGYAFQWFALAALTVGLTIWLQIIRPRRVHRAHDHVPS